MTQFSIMTYNIHKGFSVGNLRFILPGIRDAMLELNPDIVFLQEVLGCHLLWRKRIKNWPKRPQHRYLAGEQWPHMAYGKNARYKLGHHGNAILSKFPIITWDNIDVSLQKFSSRSVLHGVVELPNSITKLHIMCIHFGLLKTERHEQLKKLANRIQAVVPDDEPLIIAGDFNDWLKDASEGLQEILNLKEAFKSTTGDYAKSFPVWQPLLTVDRIYFRGLNLVESACLTTPPWTTLSDHAPLVATFSIG